VLDEDSRRALRRLAQSPTAPYRIVLRSRIVLMFEATASDRGVAAALRVAPRTVRRWRLRFQRGGLEALLRDAPGRGRKSTRAPRVEARLRDYLHRKQRGEAVPTLRQLSASLDIALGSVHRLIVQLKAKDLQESGDSNC
jgi:transposase